MVEPNVRATRGVPSVANIVRPNDDLLLREQVFGVATMNQVEETAAMIALLRRGDRLWHHYAALVEEAGAATAVLRGEHRGDAEHEPLLLFDPSPGPQTSEAADLDAIVREVEAWQDEGMRVLTVLDDEYPPNLRTVHNRPPLLFVRGDLGPADARSIAVVGTRQVSAQGRGAATTVASDLADAGFSVVSGLAQGVDTAAHLAALARGSRTVAVIGTGLRRSYPAANRALQERIAGVGAVVSQFWPDAAPSKRSFPMRNIVMSGLALATVVIEASHRSGARMQARIALEHGRPVFLLSSLLEHDWAREYAQRPGAHVVDSAAEVASLVERLTAPETLTA